MEPLDIKQAIERAGYTQAEIARLRGVSRSAINRVIWRGDVSAPIHKLIAKLIKRPVEEIWPDYYKKAC